MTKRLGSIFFIIWIVFFFTLIGRTEERKGTREKPGAIEAVEAAESSHDASQRTLPFSIQVAAYRLKEYAYRDMTTLREKGYEEPQFAGSLFDQAVSGQSSNIGEDIRESLNGADLDINGYVRGGLWLGRAADTDDAEAKASYGEVSVKLRARKGDAGEGYAEVRVRNGVTADEEEENLDVREAYINVYSGPFDIRFGRQIIVWGRADTINPTNNLTPYDQRVLSPDEDDRRLANFGMRSYYNAAPFRLEGVWMPTYAESHFPEFTLPPLIHLEESHYPGTNLSGGLGAVRLHYEAPAVDASVSYLYGYATYPGIELREVDLSSSPPIGVGFTAYRHSVVGCDFSTTLEDGYGLRGEMAYRRPVHYKDREEIPMPELFYVVGVDSEFQRGEVSVIVQYIGRYVFEWQEIIDRDLSSGGIPPGVPPEQLQQLILDEVELKNRMIQGQQDRVSHAGFIRAEWKLLQETLSLELVNLYNFTTHEAFFRPKVTYDIADALSLAVGGDIYQGPNNTLFGTIDKTVNAGFVEVKVSF
jgi:hypothetical protein